VICAG